MPCKSNIYFFLSIKLEIYNHYQMIIKLFDMNRYKHKYKSIGKIDKYKVWPIAIRFT